jgi:hypothetical protein
MKAQNVLRTPLLAFGLGAALLLVGSAKAQEIVNAEFEDGPYVVPFSQPVYLEATPAATPVMTESQAIQAMGVISSPAIPDADRMQAPVLERWLVALLLVVAGLLAMFILVELSMLAELKRARRTLRSGSTPHVSTRTA